MDRTVYDDFVQAGFDTKQAAVMASHVPDWSQFATRQDLGQLEIQMEQLESRLQLQMGQLESRLIRWMIGIFLTFLALLGGLITLGLNIYGILA